LTPSLVSSLRRGIRDFGDAYLGQAGEHVAQVVQWIDFAAAAALDDGVEDGSALTGIGGTDEQPVLFSEVSVNRDAS